MAERIWDRAIGEDKKGAARAWAIAHSLESEIDYYLQEVSSRDTLPTKHGLDMMLKHILSELGYIKQHAKSEPPKPPGSLFAASPAMLDALKHIVGYHEPGEDAILDAEGYNKACTAISLTK